ncbi:MAG: alpha/beta hydrolase [Chloroflexi bacterium]|nr:alpha/beta hydrolase [Chloroflexota bacterium]
MTTQVKRPTSKFVVVSNLRVHYLDWGNEAAQPLLMLHGLRGYAQAWDPIARDLSDRYHVVAWDARGRGESDWAKDQKYNLATYVSDLASFIEKLNIQKVILMGHSMGGRIGIVYSAQHPLQVAALIIVDIGPTVEAKGDERIRRELKETPDEFPSSEAARAFLKKQLPALSDRAIEARLTHSLRALPGGKLMWKYDRAIREQRLGATAPENLWPSLRALRCPTLILRGATSDILSRQTVEAMANVVAGSKWMEISGAGHLIPEENPKDMLAAVRKFLDSLSGK